MANCAKCSLPLDENAKFCASCGAAVSVGQSVAAGSGTAASPTPQVTVVEPKRGGKLGRIGWAIIALFVLIFLGLLGSNQKTTPPSPAQSSPAQSSPAQSSPAPPSPASTAIYLNCVLSNSSWGVGGWRVVLNTSEMTARASFIGSPNAWSALTDRLLDKNFALMNVPRADDYYDFGIQDQANYKLFMINKNTLAFRYIDAHTGLTEWGECRRAPVENPLP